MTEAPRLLVVRVGAMGDVLHALPAVAAVRQRWPGATIRWVVDPRWAPLLVGPDGRGPVVSGVHLAETRVWSRAPLSRATARSVLALRRELRAGRYGRVVDVQGTLRSAVIGQMAGGEEFVGFRDPREALAGLFYGRSAERRGTHVVEQNAALLSEALGEPLTPVTPELPFWPEAERWADGVTGGARTALLVPGAGWGAKRWPAERFGALARELQRVGLRVLVNASSADDSVAGEVLRVSGEPVALVVGNVAQLVALTRRAAVVVGGDSGPVHLGAALRRPVVALFGPTDPARNGPWGSEPKRVLRDAGSKTSYKRTETTEAGLGRIGVAAVVEAAREAVGGPSA